MTKSQESRVGRRVGKAEAARDALTRTLRDAGLKKSPDVSGGVERPVVRDEESGRVGELMFLGDWDDPDARPPRTYRLAFIRPLGGGIEWSTAPECVTVLPAPERARAVDGARCAHNAVRQRDGKTHCRNCDAQIYL
jgi:hypothetical protein